MVSDRVAPSTSEGRFLRRERWGDKARAARAEEEGLLRASELLPQKRQRGMPKVNGLFWQTTLWYNFTKSSSIFCGEKEMWTEGREESKERDPLSL